MSAFFPIVRASIIVLCLAGLSACTTMGGPGLLQSEVSADLSKEAADVIAADMADQLTQHLGQGKSTIAIKGDDASFGPALETALRNKGYAVVTGKEPVAETVQAMAYSVDPFEGGVLVRISTAAIELTRMYVLSAGSVAPASPLSVMKRGETSAS